MKTNLRSFRPFRKVAGRYGISDLRLCALASLRLKEPNTGRGSQTSLLSLVKARKASKNCAPLNLPTWRKALGLRSLGEGGSGLRVPAASRRVLVESLCPARRLPAYARSGKASQPNARSQEKFIRKPFLQALLLRLRLGVFAPLRFKNKEITLLR